MSKVDIIIAMWQELDPYDKCRIALIGWPTLLESATRRSARTIRTKAVSCKKNANTKIACGSADVTNSAEQ